MRVRFTYLAVLLSLPAAASHAAPAKAPVKRPTQSAPAKDAAVLLVKKQYAQAAVALSKAIALDPRNVMLYVDRSYAYGASGAYAKAQADRRRFVHLAGDGKAAPLKKSLADFTSLAKKEPNSSAAVLNLSDVYMYLENWSAADNGFNAAIALAPKSPFAYSERGFVALQLGQTEKALADFNRAIALNPNFSDSYGGRAAVYRVQKKFELALADLTKAAGLDSQRPAVYALRGAVFADFGQLEASLADYNKALSLDPLDVDSYLGRAKVHALMQHRDWAREDIDVAARLAPQNPEVYLERAQTFSEQEAASAVADLSKAIALNPKNAAAYYERGARYEAIPAHETAALADFNKAIELAPKDADAYGYRGAYYFDLDKLDLAVADLTKVLELTPNAPDVYLFRAGIYTKQGEKEKALADFRKVAALQPDNADAVNRVAIVDATAAIAADPSSAANFAKRADAEAGSGNPNAIIDYNAAIALDPKNAGYFNSRGVAYANARQSDKATDDFTQAIALDSTLIKAYENRINTTTSPEQAVADATRILEIDPKNIPAYTRRARLYLAANNSDAALADYAAIFKIDPKNVDTFVERATLYETLKQPSKAISDLNLALLWDPKNTELYGRRAKLQMAQGNYAAAQFDFKRAAADSGAPDDSADLAALSQAIAAHPQNAENYLKRARLIANSSRSTLGINEDDIGAVMADLAKAIELTPRNPEPYLLRAKIFSDSRQKAFDLDKALADCDAALQFNAKNAALLNVRGNAHLLRGQYAESMADYLGAGKLDPGYIPGEYGRELNGADEGQQKAVAFFTEAVKAATKSAATYINRGAAYAELRIWDKAIADYNQAITLEPKNGLAFLLRGVAYDVLAQGGEMGSAEVKQVKAKAIEDYGQAIRFDPSLSAAYFWRGQMLEREKPAQALGDYTSFIKINPRYAAHAYYLRAELYITGKEWDKALSDYADFQRLPKPASLTFNPYPEIYAPMRRASAQLGKGDYAAAIAGFTDVLKSPSESVNGAYMGRAKAYSMLGDTTKALADLDAAIANRADNPEPYAMRAALLRKLGLFERAGADEAMVSVLSKKT